MRGLLGSCDGRYLVLHLVVDAGQVGPVRAALAPAVRLLGFVVGLVAAGLLRAMVQAAMVPDVAVDSAQKEAGAPEPVAEGA